MLLEKSLIDKLHEAKIIDKKSVLWWQLGFEGRRQVTDQEFSSGLRTIKYESISRDFFTTPDSFLGEPKPKPEDYCEESVRVWINDNVPILIKEIEFGKFVLPAFVTVKPMSHSPSGWDSLQSAIVSQWPPSLCTLGAYEQPHIRGIALDLTKDFLFWYAFLLDSKSHRYSSDLLKPKNLEYPPLILDPINPVKFCQNLIEKGWRGRRSQRKPHTLDIDSAGFEFVPYFEFNPSQPQSTIYPLPMVPKQSLREVKDFLKHNPGWTYERAERLLRGLHFIKNPKNPLDLPAVLVSSGNSKVNILGAGYCFHNREVSYWPLDKTRHALAGTALKSRLGLEAEVYS